MRDDIKKALDKNKEINKLFTTLGFNKTYENLERYLSPEETVLYVRNGNIKINNTENLKENAFSIKDKVPAIVAVTDKRVLAYFKVLTNEKLEQFPIVEIRAYDFKLNSLHSSVFRITSLTKSFDIDLTPKKEEVEYLHNVLNGVIKKTNSEKQEISNSGTTDIPQIIRELSKLRDDGILSDEQFENKKLELLSKI